MLGVYHPILAVPPDLSLPEPPSRLSSSRVQTPPHSISSVLPSVQWFGSDLVKSNSELPFSDPKVAIDPPLLHCGAGPLDLLGLLSDSQLPPVPLGKQDSMEVQKASESDTCESNSGSPFTSCVMVGNIYSISEPQFPHLSQHKTPFIMSLL